MMMESAHLYIYEFAKLRAMRVIRANVPKAYQRGKGVPIS